MGYGRGGGYYGRGDYYGGGRGRLKSGVKRHYDLDLKTDHLSCYFFSTGYYGGGGGYYGRGGYGGGGRYGSYR